jgi:hypothetical protein
MQKAASGDLHRVDSLSRCGFSVDIARTVFAGRRRTVKTRSTLNAPMPVLIARVHNRGDFAASDLYGMFGLSRPGY